MPKTIRPATINVIFTVLKFRDAVKGAIRHRSLTDYRISLRPSGRRVGVWLINPDIVHVRRSIRLRFSAVGRREKYQVVGIAFAAHNRAAGSGAISLSTGTSRVKGSPFKTLKLQKGVLDLVDIVPPPAPEKSWIPKLYKFTLLIQRVRDGAIGLIDPYLENEN